ncbi:RIB43A-like with coiled-coils protein 2 isoform X2 [Macrotis lagotis]
MEASAQGSAPEGPRSRWLNPRERMIGGDYNAWTAQVHDRKIQEATQRGKHETFGAEMRQNDRIACLLEERERRDRRSLQEALTEFRQTFQKPEDGREFDLSDPLALRKDVPAWVSDQEVLNTVSGLQNFMGEDLNVVERKRAQQEQNREWLLEQQRSQNHALANLKLAEDTFTETRLEFDQTAMNLQKLELDTRRAMCTAVKDFNKNQILEVVERKQLERRQEEEDNMVEISNIMQSDFLRPHRVLLLKWKEHLEEAQQFQKQQMHQKQRLQEEEKQQDFDWDRQRIQAARANILFERQQRRLHRELRRNMDNENLNLAQKHKSL